MLEDARKAARALRWCVTPNSTCALCDLYGQGCDGTGTNGLIADLLDAKAAELDCKDAAIAKQAQELKDALARCVELEAKCTDVTRQRDECKRKLYLLYCRSCWNCGNFDPNRTCELNCNEDNGMYCWTARGGNSENAKGATPDV